MGHRNLPVVTALTDTIFLPKITRFGAKIDDIVVVRVLGDELKNDVNRLGLAEWVVRGLMGSKKVERGK